MEGREDEIRPCINCHNACFTMCKHGDSANDQTLEDAIHMARCALNPQTMQSGKYKIVPARKPKTVAIIGGGIGGMEAALVLKARGHKPVIYEKSDTLGGTFIQAAAFSYKEHDKRLIQWYRNEIASQGIPVKFNTEISAIDDLKEDRVLIATGGKPNRPRIPGLSEYAIEPLDFLSGKKPVGDNVLIIGGGLTGCEIAYELVLQGKKPQIVEMLDDLISAKGVCLANSSFLREMLAFKKVPVHLRTKLVEVTPSGAKVQALDGNKTNKQPGKQFEIKADSVITCMGYHPSPLAAKPSSKVRRIGDALEVGNLRTTIWSAWDAAMKI
ncbi:MAG: FAD-dependent oxidoreductase [Sphaerochaetaceae bacterium]